MLTAGPGFARSIEKAPPPPPCQKISTLVPLPNFLPGQRVRWICDANIHKTTA